MARLCRNWRGDFAVRISHALSIVPALQRAPRGCGIGIRLNRTPASSLYPSGFDLGAFNDLLDAAEKLNTLRNKLAHHLEHPQIEIHRPGFQS